MARWLLYYITEGSQLPLQSEGSRTQNKFEGRGIDTHPFHQPKAEQAMSNNQEIIRRAAAFLERADQLRAEARQVLEPLNKARGWRSNSNTGL